MRLRKTLQDQLSLTIRIEETLNISRDSSYRDVPRLKLRRCFYKKYPHLLTLGTKLLPKLPTDIARQRMVRKFFPYPFHIPSNVTNLTLRKVTKGVSFVYVPENLNEYQLQEYAFISIELELESGSIKNPKHFQSIHIFNTLVSHINARVLITNSHKLAKVIRQYSPISPIGIINNTSGLNNILFSRRVFQQTPGDILDEVIDIAGMDNKPRGFENFDIALALYIQGYTAFNEQHECRGHYYLDRIFCF